MLTILGSCGLGAVWGWLLALVGGRASGGLRAIISPAAALLATGGTAALIATVSLFGEAISLAAFGLSAALALGLHLTFLAALRQRTAGRSARS